MSENRDQMNTFEMARLSDWLKAKGHNAEDVLDCIDYIAYGEEKNKMSGSHTHGCVERT